MVLDTCEHLVEACGALGAHLLPPYPRLPVLATSRQPLNVPGERVGRIPALALPRFCEGLSVDPVPRADAVQLFTERVSTVLGLPADPGIRGGRVRDL